MKLKKDDGFTMLEVMIGLVIFTLGLVLLSSMMMISLKANKWSDRTTQTVQLIRDKIEEAKNTDPALMNDGSDVVNGIARSWTFNDVTNNLKELEVIVTWHDEREAAHACTTTTFLQIGS